MRVIFAAALALSIASASTDAVYADPPELEGRVEALGPVREGEQPIYEQIGRALETAETASSEGESARAQRHRDLALALVRSLEARRRIADLRARIGEREVALRSARERLERARGARTQAETDRTRVESAR